MRAAVGLFLLDSPSASADRAPRWGLRTTPGPRMRARPWRSGPRGPCVHGGCRGPVSSPGPARGTHITESPGPCSSQGCRCLQAALPFERMEVTYFGDPILWSKRKLYSGSLEFTGGGIKYG